MSKTYDIKLTPTIFDAYEWLAAQDDDDRRAEAYAALMDKLNHRRTPSTEAADRGTALNNIVDDLLFGPKMLEGDERIIPHTYQTSIGGKMYVFDAQLCKALAGALEDAGDYQVYGEAIVNVDGCRVKLYGYADYIMPDGIMDLKTTTTYAPNKFRGHWQHRVYPIIMDAMGFLPRKDCTLFRYLVAELTRDEPYGATLYNEDYVVDFDDYQRQTIDFLSTQLLPFIERHRGDITDDYIFR